VNQLAALTGIRPASTLLFYLSAAPAFKGNGCHNNQIASSRPASVLTVEAGLTPYLFNR
jgi:hypothetical protein